MFGLSQIKSDLAALESKVSVDVKADITTLMATVKNIESSIEVALQTLFVRVEALENKLVKNAEKVTS